MSRMALRYLFDEHLRGPLPRAVRQHAHRMSLPVEIIEVGEVPEVPLGASDAEILSWIEHSGHILVSNDRTTLAEYLRQHLSLGGHCPGVFMVRRTRTLQIAEFLILAAHVSDPAEWQDKA
jgi:hypothetical protein